MKKFVKKFICRVCRRWNRSCRDPYVLRSVHFTGHQYPLTKSVKRLHGTHTHSGGRDRPSRKLRQFYTAFSAFIPHMTTLTVTGTPSRSNRHELSVEKSILALDVLKGRHFPSLRVVNFRGVGLSSAGLCDFLPRPVWSSWHSPTCVYGTFFRETWRPLSCCTGRKLESPQTFPPGMISFLRRMTLQGSRRISRNRSWMSRDSMRREKKIIWHCPCGEWSTICSCFTRNTVFLVSTKDCCNWLLLLKGISR